MTPQAATTQLQYQLYSTVLYCALSSVPFKEGCRTLRSCLIAPSVKIVLYVL